MCLQMSMVFSLNREEDLHSNTVPLHAILCCGAVSLLFQAREQKTPPGTRVILQRLVGAQMKFDHIQCWFKSCFGPATTLLNPEKSFVGKFAGESALLTTSQHRLLLAFLHGNKCHAKEGKRICFYFFSWGIKSTKSHGPVSVHNLIRLFFSGLFSSLIYI